MMDDFKAKYNEWLIGVTGNDDLLQNLKNMNPNELQDAFYCDLEFGTAGLRGILGAGSNRMNVFTVARATQGFSEYILEHYTTPSVAISYDSRHKSIDFAQTAACVFAANGIHVYIYRSLMPTPCLSFAVRYYHCAGGVMITASHNPAKYNGYKAYAEDGCQITETAAHLITDKINQIDFFTGIKSIQFDLAIQNGLISYIDNDCIKSYYKEVKNTSVLYQDKINKDFSIVYSPLNGTGLIPVTSVLKDNGFNHVAIVEEQRYPDGNFTTCPYPNPEIRQAMELGVQYAQKNHADLLLATDPDCDRVGIAVRNGNDMQLLTGNEVGVLLLDYICSQKIKHNKMPSKPLMVKTIVTTDMIECLCKYYHIRLVNVLTGFKYIGEQIGILEKDKAESNFILGFEESYGYLSGTYVRDKDAVNASFLICEMFAYYKTNGIDLIEKLNSLYLKFGFYLNKTVSFEYDGVDGNLKMQSIMNAFREGMNQIGEYYVTNITDYKKGIAGLPCSNVIQYQLNNRCSMIIRPSGTEPKIKIYISVVGKSQEEALTIQSKLILSIQNLMNN